MAVDSISITKPDFYYLLVEIVTDNAQQLDELQVVNVIAIAMKESFGLIGTSIPVDLLKLQGNIAYLRVNFGSRNALMAALPLIKSYAGINCQIKVKRESAFLVSIMDV